MSLERFQISICREEKSEVKVQGKGTAIDRNST
ncbi:hypothetical protein PGS_00015210 [Porphyromonas gingivalis A7A1-28]|nr:hypothetical protein PGS_00015210 [Porphyromonas gingivalis A7A1-28]